MNWEFIFFVVITIMDLSAAVIIFVGSLSERMRLYPTWHKVGLIIAVIGLISQSFRNVQYLYTGVSPSDVDVPLWVFKDAGIAIIAFTYLSIAIKKHFFGHKVNRMSKNKSKNVQKKN